MKFELFSSKKEAPEPENLEASPETIKRRRNTISLLLGLGACAALEIGCTPRNLEILAPPRIEKTTEQKIPQEFLSLLKKNEYIIPNEVMNSYGRAVDERIRNNPELFGLPGGTTIDINRLGKNAHQFFQKDMRERGFTEEEIERFVLMLSRPGNIIITESVATKNPEESPIMNLPRVLAHERTHGFIHTLDEKEIEILKKAWEGLQKQTVKEEVAGMGETDTPLIRDKIFIIKKWDTTSAFSAFAIDSNWTELYAYLAQGALDERVEKALQAQYPEAYKIFERCIRKTQQEKIIKTIKEYKKQTLR